MTVRDFLWLDEIVDKIAAKHAAIETALAAKLRETARQRGVSAKALLNEWVREKAAEGETVGDTH